MVLVLYQFLARLFLAYLFNHGGNGSKTLHAVSQERENDQKYIFGEKMVICIYTATTNYRCTFIAG